MLLGLFALDAFSGRGVLAALAGCLWHLVPALLILVIVMVSWRRPWVGGVLDAVRS